jgi:hypothetical protein
LELADAELLGAFVKAEPNVDGVDVPTEIKAVQLGCINQCVVCVIEREIVPSKSKRLSCPDACIGCLRDDIVADPFFKSSLGVFGDS